MKTIAEHVIEYLKSKGWEFLNEHIFYRFKNTEELIDFSMINRLLVILFCGIGDMTIFIPALEMLSGTFRKSNISVLTHSPVDKVLLNHPSVDQILLSEAINSINFQDYDLIINISGQDEYINDVILSSGVRCIIRNVVFNKTDIVHFKEIFIETIQEIIASIRSKFIYISEQERSYARKYLIDKGFFLNKNLIVAIHPGSGNTIKNWDWQGFSEVCDFLIKNYEAKILLISGPKETDIVDKILGKSNGPISVVQESLRSVAGILEQCDFLITNDSGIMHIADAVGTPTISIFIESQPEIWGPMGYNHVVIYKPREFGKIAVYDVKKGIELMISHVRKN